MAAANFPPCPASLKPLMHYLKVAQEHDERNPIVAYWCRLHALQVGLKISSGHKSKEETALLAALMDWLEATKKSMADNEGITNEVCAQAAIEDYVLKMFGYADEQDRSEVFNKNLVKAFYTCGIIMDVLSVFGELSEDLIEKQKYSKWKAAYIHNCLKNGELPIPGPMSGTTEDNVESKASTIAKPTTPTSPGPSGFQQPMHPPAGGGNSFGPVPFAGFVHRDTPTGLPGNTDNTYQPNVYDPSNPIPSTSIPTPNPVFPPINPVVSKRFDEDVNNLPVLSADQVTKAQKYCKWASSALNYDDNKTAVLNLRKALQLLQTGEDPS